MGGRSRLAGLAPLPAIGRPLWRQQQQQQCRTAAHPPAAAGAAAPEQERQSTGLFGALVESVRSQFQKLDGLWDK